MTTRGHIFDAIGREREYQDAKWRANPHTVGEWLLIVESELQEAKQAWCKTGGDFGALEELLQVIAVGVAALEQHGVFERPNITMLTKMLQSEPMSANDVHHAFTGE